MPGAAAAAVAATLVVVSTADDVVEASGNVVDSLFGKIDEMESEFEDDYSSTTVESYGPLVPAEEQSEPVPPVDLGDDPDLDADAQACFAGDYSSCDDLYFDSKPLSEYERYAMSCGGRVKPEYGGYCTDLE